MLDHATQCIFDDRSRALFAAQRLIVGQLNSFLSRVVDVSKSECVCSYLRGRIVAALLFKQTDTGQIRTF